MNTLPLGFAGEHSWTNTSWYQTGSPSLSSGKFGGRGSFLHLQQISKSLFVSVSLQVFHSDASEDGIRLYVAPFVSGGRKESKRAVTFSSVSHGSSVFPAAGVKLDRDGSYARTSDGFYYLPARLPSSQNSVFWVNQTPNVDDRELF